MAAASRYFRLVEGPGRAGLSCTQSGVSLAGVALLRKTGWGFEPRPPREIDVLLRAAYGDTADADSLSLGLASAARALSDGDLSGAMVASLLLRLPDLDADAVARIGSVDIELGKYNPDQPRDWHGRWTSGGGDGPSSESGHPSGSLRFEQNPCPAEVGDNEPPLEPPVGPVVEPDFNAPRVPQGWDVPGQSSNGLYTPPTRNPTLANGEPWPIATHDLIKDILAPQGARPSTMTLFVPFDKIGPTLIGSTRSLEYKQPPGYDVVTLVGTPQRTFSGGVETGHARDSIDEALELAATNQFSHIFFNRAFSTASGHLVQSRIRPDVLAVVRPGLELDHVYHPYESLSPGQELPARQEQMRDLPQVQPAQGQHYKAFGTMRSPYFRYLGRLP